MKRAPLPGPLPARAERGEGVGSLGHGGCIIRPEALFRPQLSSAREKRKRYRADENQTQSPCVKSTVRDFSLVNTTVPPLSVSFQPTE